MAKKAQKTDKVGTLTKIGRTVKDAARAVVETADDYVVTPVGEALGIKEPAPEKPAPKARRKAARKKLIEAAEGRPMGRRKSP
jgi:hypothetical protein